MQLIFLNNWFTDETLQALGWTLFHSLWIGLLAAALSGIIIISTRRSSARLRYNLLMGVLFLFLLACTVTFFVQNRPSGIPVVELQDTGTIPASALSSPGQFVAAPAGFIDQFTRYFNSNADLFVLVWMIFFVVHCIKLAAGLTSVQRLRNHKTYLPGEEWVIKLNELGNRLGIRQSVKLLQSELVKVPVAVGFLKPVILVPLGLLSNLPPVQVEAILLHELSHIRRRDYLINLIQRFAETIFFFNPSFTWLSSLIRQEREACCDDMVVATTGQEGNYLEALVSFQEYSASSPLYVMAIKSKQHYLLNRVKRLLTRENKKLGLMEKLLLMAGLIVFTAFTIIPQNEKAEAQQMDLAGSLKQQNIITLQKEEPGKITINRTNNIKLPSRSVTRDTIPVRENSKGTGAGTGSGMGNGTGSGTGNGNGSGNGTGTGADTIPGKSGTKINNISTTTNDDGKTKKQSIIATDQTGKRYIITKLNDKVTFFQVDDKVIPENEMGNYASVFEQINAQEEKNKARKLKELEKVKLDYEKKKNIFESKQQQLNIKENNKADLSKQAIEKKIEKRREELEIERKVLNQQREELTAVKKELEFKKKEVKTKDGKEKELGEKEIKNKEAIINIKLKEIEKRKEGMEIKKKEIGHEKEKLELEKLKEKQIKLQKETTISIKPGTTEVSKTLFANRSTKLFEKQVRSPDSPDAPGWQPAPSKPIVKRPGNRIASDKPRVAKMPAMNL